MKSFTCDFLSFSMLLFQSQNQILSNIVFVIIFSGLSIISSQLLELLFMLCCRDEHRIAQIVRVAFFPSQNFRLISDEKYFEIVQEFSHLSSMINSIWYTSMDFHRWITQNKNCQLNDLFIILTIHLYTDKRQAMV